ncbi:MFS transporter [Kitasatospora sp. LaBMicrA B282]|uniref:MFS transporter n=1 Tax=Kitasatospora sp. LaBMicrA B282 TaxID=3420949 RepID=UPI003D0D7DCB
MTASSTRSTATAARPPARRRMSAGGGLSRGMTVLFAVAGGLGVANIYYAQPLLTVIADAFHCSTGTASLVATATTLGYTIGLALLVPMGDLVNRRRLVVTLLLLVAVTECAAAGAPSIGALVVSCGLMSVTAVVAPLLVSFAATLARPEQRGRVTGTVMSGVLGGVLLARTGAGLVAQWAGGWRAVFLAAAVLMLLLAGVLHRSLPDLPPGERLRYPRLLGSVLAVVREEPLLRLRCAYGFLTFASFSAFWASVAFLLARPPYSFGEGLIGAFGLLGAAGALAARLTGPLVDRGRDRLATTVLLGAVLLSWGLLALDGGRWPVPLVLGVLLLDFGVQGNQVTNLGVLFQLRPEARSRITMAYMATYFLGGVAGSALSGVLYAAAGWGGVCTAGAGLALLALLLWTAESAGRRRRAAATGPSSR